MGRKKHCTENERVLIRKLREEGKTYKEIRLGCFQNKVTTALKPKKISENRGRPRKTNTVTHRFITRLAKKDPFSSSKSIKYKSNVDISARTIKRRLEESNLHWRTARKVPLKRIFKRVSNLQRSMASGMNNNGEVYHGRMKVNLT